MSSSIYTGVFDCDTHCYEPRDAATRYLDKKYADASLRVVKSGSGEDVVLAGNRIAHFNSEQGIGFDYAYLPGSLKQLLKEMASENPNAEYMRTPMQPEYLEREPRMKVLDEQGVDRCVLFPSAIALSAEGYVDNTEALYANLHSYNRWFDETWGFNYQDRLYATALLSLRDLDEAVKLTDTILNRGAKVVMLPTGPAYGRGPADPYYDAVWSRLNEAEVVVALHIMPNWYFETFAKDWGQNSNPASWSMSAWGWMNLYGERPVVDTISSMIYDNLFGRYPNLGVVIAEHGASWLPHTLDHLDKSRGMGRNGPWVGGQLKERPSAIFKRHVRVAPYAEDNVPRIIELLDGDDSCLVFGSDFPHAEGVVTPAEFDTTLTGLSDEVKQRIMRTNAETLFDRV